LAKIDLGTTTPKPEGRGKRWIEVPARDLHDFPYPTIRVNLLEFPSGRHFVDAELADFIEDRIALKFQADVRVMRPNQDYVSTSAMNRFGTGSRIGTVSKNPDADFAEAN
jgi:hypothetical protein